MFMFDCSVGLVLENLGAKMSDEQIDEMVSEVDKDGDGNIDYQEFLELMMGK